MMFAGRRVDVNGSLGPYVMSVSHSIGAMLVASVYDATVTIKITIFL